MTKTCRICGGADAIALDRRSPVPIAQNLILPTQQIARDCPAGAIDMQRCTACGFVWNDAFDPALMVYDVSYDNNQNYSSRFLDHVTAVAERIEQRIGGSGRVDLVEVGCGQGAFMRIMRERLGPRLASAIGFDPAWQGDSGHLPSNVEVRGTYFGAGSIRSDDPPPSVIVSRHVIEHVPDPLAFLRAIRAGVTVGTPIFIETPDVDWILRNGVFFDFYYEHCSIFAQSTLTLALERAGFIVENVSTMFDDQYQLAVGVAGPMPAGVEPTLPAGRHDDLSFVAKRKSFLDSLATAIDQLGSAGSVALWGGASKGVTICLTLPDAARRIAGAIDINARKQGCFLPTSGIPILSPAAAAAQGVKAAIVVNPTYLDEVRASLVCDGIQMEVISIDQACLRGTSAQSHDGAHTH